VKSGKCPILNEDCDRIAVVAKSKKAEIQKLEEKLTALKEKFEKFNKAVKKKRELEDVIGKLEAEIESRDRIEREIAQKEEFLKIIEGEINELKGIIEEKQDVERELKEVEGSIERRFALLDKISHKNEILLRIESKKGEIAEIEEKLKGFDRLSDRLKELRSKIEELREILDSNRSKFERFVSLQGAVAKKDKILKEMDELSDQRDRLKAELDEIIGKIAELKAGYDEGELKRLKEEFQELVAIKSEAEGRLKSIDDQIEELKKEIEECRKREEMLKKKKEDKKKLERKYRFIKDLREIFRKAIPEITKAYVEAVSVEANRIFCEIMGDYNWELRWTEDFGIKAKYMGRDIDFTQMSGGEQICAALAVRLALLKVLSNIGIVFLDEPTQNMDETRRRNFATQLSRIEGFKQIFVISHDDTFEEMVEHAIKVRKENGVSVVE